jgi:AbiTii
MASSFRQNIPNGGRQKFLRIASLTMEPLSDHKLELASELLTDIELGRISADKVLLKASRLARIIGDEQTLAWLHYELYGYNSTDELSVNYMGWTGRWTDFDKKLGWWHGLAQIEAQIDAYRAKLDTLRLPDIASDYAAVALNQIRQDSQATSTIIGTLSGIRSKVMALLHRFATVRYYELAFSSRQETIFESAKSAIDALLAPVSGEALKQVDVIYERLSEGDPEAVSQALLTCRRLIDGFADAVFPARDEPLIIDGSEVKLTAQHHQNRINAFVREHSQSASRRNRLRRRLEHLYERVAAGVHSDVSPDEARFLFLDTYLLLGEILSLDVAQLRLPAGATNEGGEAAEPQSE